MEPKTAEVETTPSFPLPSFGLQTTPFEDLDKEPPFPFSLLRTLILLVEELVVPWAPPLGFPIPVPTAKVGRGAFHPHPLQEPQGWNSEEGSVWGSLPVGD